MELHIVLNHLVDFLFSYGIYIFFTYTFKFIFFDYLFNFILYFFLKNSSFKSWGTFKNLSDLNFS